MHDSQCQGHMENQPGNGFYLEMLASLLTISGQGSLKEPVGPLSSPGVCLLLYSYDLGSPALYCAQFIVTTQRNMKEDKACPALFLFSPVLRDPLKIFIIFIFGKARSTSGRHEEGCLPVIVLYSRRH